MTCMTSDERWIMTALFVIWGLAVLAIASEWDKGSRR